MKNFIFLSLFFLWALSSRGETITIGDGTTTDRYPLNDYYVYSLSQSLYLAGEINLNGMITNLRWYRNDVGADPNAIGITEIWLMETTNTVLSGTTWEGPGTLVAAISNIDLSPGGGWFDIPITNFNYVGSNLLVSVRTQNAPYVTPHAYWRYTATTSYRMRRGNSDTQNPPTMALSYNRPNIQFEVITSESTLSVFPVNLDFGYTQSGSNSAEKTYQISGSNLTGLPVTVTAPDGFEVSLTAGGGFGSLINILYAAPNLPNTTVFVRFSPQEDNLEYNGIINNSGGGAANKIVTITGNSWMHNKWCISSATNILDTEILGVSVGAMNNPSDCVTPAPGPGSILKRYSNYYYAVAPPELPIGGNVDFTVTVGTCGSNYNNAIKIFIDYNSDGDFADAGEEVFVSATYINGPHIESGIINIPADATTGETMMRIVCMETTNLSAILACGTYSYGETEDYRVKIVQSLPEEPLLTIPDVYSDPTIQNGQTVVVSGYYTTPETQILINDYIDWLRDRVMLPNSYLILDGIQPPSNAWNGGYIIVSGIIQFITNPDGDIIAHITVDEFLLIKDGQGAIQKNNIENEILEPKVCDPCKFAILISGGYDAANNHSKYWENLVALYKFKTEKDGYCPENVLVNYYNGTRRDARIPQGNVTGATNANISSNFTEISRRVGSCTRNGNPATFQKLITNHGAANGDINLMNPNVLTPHDLKVMEQKIIDSCCTTMKDELIECYAGKAVDSLKTINNLNKATIYVNSAADQTCGYSTDGQVHSYLAAKIAALTAGSSYEQSVVAAKLAYDNYLQGWVNNAHQNAQGWRNTSPGWYTINGRRVYVSQAAINNQVALWVADSTELASAICQSRNETVTPMKQYCEWKEYVVPPGGQLVLNFTGDPANCGNISVYKGNKTNKVGSWNWNVPGSRRYAEGYSQRVINGDPNATTTFWIHNDNGAFTLKSTSKGNHNLPESAFNAIQYPGFSFGGTDYVSAEFSNIIAPDVFIQNIDHFPFNTLELPASLGQQYVQNFGFSFTINTMDEYWTNMELYLRINEVTGPGTLMIMCENSPEPMHILSIMEPGVYTVPMGNMTVAGDYGYMQMMAQGVSFSLDCWGLRSVYELNPPIAFAGSDATTCEGDVFVLTGATASNYSSLMWTTSGDGAFNDPFVLHPVYTSGPSDLASGSVQLCITAMPIPPFTGEVNDCMTLAIQNNPTVFAGADATILAGESFIIPAMATHFSSVLWTTSGSGYFDDPMLLNPTYFPGTGDAGITVTNCITANPVNPCQISEMDCMSLFVQPAQPVTYWLPFTSAPEGTPPEINVTYGDEYVTNIHLTVNGMWVTQKEENGIIFHQLEIPGYTTTHEPGKPAMPALRELLGVISNAEYVQFYGTVLNSMEFQGFNVYPYQTPLNEEATGTFDYNAGFYASNITYPATTGEALQLQSLNEIDVSGIVMYPVTFNPVTHKIIARNEMNIHLEHQQGKGSKSTSLFVSKVWSSLYSRLLINYNALLPYLAFDPHLNANYLVIVADNYYNNILPLSNWKKLKGYNVTVKKASTIANPLTSKAVFDTISAFYNKSTDCDNYVLLVGDVGSNPLSQIPTYTAYAGLYGYNMISDYYYSCMGGANDYYADLFLGRLSVKNTTEVDDMVTTILNYEKNPPSDEWVKKALLVAHKESYPQKYTGCKENIRKFAYTVTTPTFDTVYGGSGGNNTNVTNAINAGRNIVNYRGHGSTTDWYNWNSSLSPKFTTTNVQNLNNGNYTPLVYSIACWNNEIDNASDCIGEVWMKKKKAVSHFGATRPSPTTHNHTLDELLFKATYDKAIYHQGAVNNYAKTQMLNQYGINDATAVGEARMYLLLGEPEMEIWTDIPATFAVTCADSIDTGSQTLNVKVKNSSGNNVYNALVCLWKGSEVFANEYTDVVGSTSFSINPTSAGTMYVTVTKHNYKPCQDSVVVRGKQSDIWIRDCLADNATVPSNGNCPSWWTSTDLWIDNNGDGIQDAPVVGAVNKLYVRPRNLGPANATNVTVDLYYRNNTTGLAFPAGATVIGSLTGLTIPAAGSTSGSVNWTVPAPPSNGGHYCIGAVLSATYDPQTSTSPVWDNNVCCVNLIQLYARAGTPAKTAIQPVLADFLLKNPFSQTQTFILSAEINLPSGWTVDFSNSIGQPVSLPYYVTLAPEEERLINLRVTPKQTTQHGDEALIAVMQYYEQGYPDITAIVGGINFPVIVDLYPPMAINDLSVSQQGNQNMLQWTPVTVDVNGFLEKTACYNIYSGDSPDFVPAPANRIGRAALDQDEAVPGFQWFDPASKSNYFYIVKVEDEAGYESGNSNLGFSGTQQIVSIPEGWSGISGYLKPENPAIEAMFAPVMSNLIILYNLTEVYWPGGGIYSLENWDEYSGYVIKVNNDVNVLLSGFDIPNKTINLNSGWNLIPVLSNQPFNIESLLGGLGNLIVAKDVAGGGVYWTQYEINTIGNVLPGKAYFVWTNAGITINYSLPGGKASLIKPVDISSLITPWNSVISTPASHLVAFNVAGDTFRSGDIIGAFTLDGWCAGLTEINIPAKPFAIQVNGDDKISSQKEGFESSEPLTFKRFRQSTGEISDLEVSYNSAMDPGYFRNNGLSEVIEVNIKSSDPANFAGSCMQIYPNPNDGTFTITGSGKYVKVKIYTGFGKEIYFNHLDLPAKVDISTQPKGIYFIKIETSKSLFFEKLIIY